LELYKRLSNAAHDPDAVADILAEMQDRYGLNPTEVDALESLWL